MQFTVDLSNGYLVSLPAATRDFITRKLTKAEARGDIAIRFKGDHWPNQFVTGDVNPELMGARRAQDFVIVTPWRGAESGKR